MSSANATSTAASAANEGMDSFLRIDRPALTALASAKPWMNDPKHFKTVQVAAGAAIKMMSHAVSGVKKGLDSANGVPVEVMGMMLGRACTEKSGTLIVTDAFPLPIEGFETKVLTDDQEVLDFMIKLSESLERTREEKFMGWYHSHPFDVGVHSHAYLSSTDMSTQLAWQRSEDRNGNPWVAIVIDPLRSLAKGKPEMGAFRAYPPEYAPPNNETPDGTIETNDKTRMEKWGTCWNRYHNLEVRFFMSSLSANVLGLISRRYLWTSAISTTPTLENENKDRFAERVNVLRSTLQDSATMLKHADLGFSYGGGSRGGGSRGGRPRGGGRIGSALGTSAGAAGGNGSRDRQSGNDSFEKSMHTSCELSIEQVQCQLSQVVKHLLFCSTR